MFWKSLPSWKGVGGDGRTTSGELHEEFLKISVEDWEGCAEVIDALAFFLSLFVGVMKLSLQRGLPLQASKLWMSHSVSDQHW